MFMKEKKEKRFIKKYTSSNEEIEITVDTITGVNYIVMKEPYAGITPLLDNRGKVVIDNIDDYIL